MKKFATMMAAVACTLTLSACGGGGDDSSNSDTGNMSTGETGTDGNSNSEKLAFRYMVLPEPLDGLDQASFLTTINQEGAQGYRYLGDGSFDLQVVGGVTVATSASVIFVNDGVSSSYAYELLPYPSAMTELVNQANTEGAKGYRYDGPQTFSDSPAPYALYRKDNGSSATYTYASDPATNDTNAWLAQANQRGQSGYWFFGSKFVFGGPTSQIEMGSNLYMKNNASNATYAYNALPAPATLADLLTQFNNEGAKGYRAKSGIVIGSQTVWLYIKDQTQTASFTYLSDTEQTTGAAFIDQANSYSAKGYAYYGEVLPSGIATVSTSNDIVSGNPVSFYFKVSNCNDFLCTVLNPITQN
jgi:hypothetical protein